MPATPPLPVTWGQRVEQARGARGLTQAALAAALSISPSTVSRIEAGTLTPSDKLRVSLAAALGVPANELFAYPDAA